MRIRRKSGCDPFEEAFKFLVRDFGFRGPVVTRVSHETHHVYEKEETRIDVFTDSGPSPILIIDVGKRHVTIWDFEWTFLQSLPAGRSYRQQLEAAAAFIQAHPEVLTGDLSELERRQTPAQSKKRLKPPRPPK